MGVPSFFKWLARKYPQILKDVVENFVLGVDGLRNSSHKQLDDDFNIFDINAIDIRDPNPNGQEFDNLYLDMNGIIHPCTHPEEGKAPSTEAEMYRAVLSYIDVLVANVRPRKVLFMAIDGVAPRAKMNQQRSRRYRSAQDASDQLEAERLVRNERDARRGDGYFDGNEPEIPWDSNVITPGTKFMFDLAKVLEHYVHTRISTHPGWKNLKVVISDANVPGEGEHKIMDYIRNQRSFKEYNPNTRHVIYGLDADLIMLSLATHEPNFWILREVVMGGPQCELCNDTGHRSISCPSRSPEWAEKIETDRTNAKIPQSALKPFQLVDISILREYLNREFIGLQATLKIPYDLERLIDDFVFLCFFVGNDFLPHMPSLSIRDGAITQLMDIYRNSLPNSNSYLTDNGKINWKFVDIITQKLGELEDNYFIRKMQKDKNYKRRSRERARNRERDIMNRPDMVSQAIPLGKTGSKRTHSEITPNESTGSTTSSNKDAAKLLKEELMGETDKPEEATNEEIDPFEPHDQVKLGLEGWKDRFYKVKFNVDVKKDGGEFQNKIAESYCTGLQWVLLYYYQGCPSWNWYFPYHYSPFCSDLKNTSEHNTDMELGTPFQPFQQLMAVLPPASNHCLPESYSKLLQSYNSPLSEFYPKRVEIDMNGKPAKLAWLGIALLPWIEEEKLLKELKGLEDTLTEEEKERNSLKPTLVLVHSSNSISKIVKSNQKSKAGLVELNPEVTAGLGGSFKLIVAHDDSPCPSHLDVNPTLGSCNTFVFDYDFRKSKSDKIVFKNGLLPGVILTKKLNLYHNSNRNDYRRNQNYNNERQQQSYNGSHSNQQQSYGRGYQNGGYYNNGYQNRQNYNSGYGRGYPNQQYSGRGYPNQQYNGRGYPNQQYNGRNQNYNGVRQQQGYYSGQQNYNPQGYQYQQTPQQYQNQGRGGQQRYQQYNRGYQNKRN